MNKKTILVIALLFSLNFVLADITLSQPAEFYNLGDKITVSVDGLIGKVSGNFNVNLICGNSTTNLVKIPASSFSVEEESSYEFTKLFEYQDLEITNFDNLLGTCQITAQLGNDYASTETFIVSKNIIVSGTLNKTNFNPAEEIIINILATKANGLPLNGFVRGENITNFEVEVIDGIATATFNTSETLEAGFYNLVLNAYDQLNGAILNEGSSNVLIEINQIPVSIILSLSDSTLTPGENFSIGAEILDQSGKNIFGSIHTILTSSLGEEIELNLQAGTFEDIDFPLNSTVGTWKASATYGGIEEIRDFEVAEIKKAKFNITDTILYIENIGNVNYDKPIEISIGEELLELNLNIAVGEIRKFDLKAPQGEYNVIVSDGENPYSRSVLLSGRAISISDFKEKGFFSMSFIGIFILIILVGLGIFFYLHSRKIKTISEATIDKKAKWDLKGLLTKKVPSKLKGPISDSINFTNKSPKSQSLDVKNHSSEDSTMRDFTKEGIGTAESVLVLKGGKYPSAVTSISIRNSHSLGPHAQEELKKIIFETKYLKGLVDWRGDYIFIVFSPLFTKTYKNENLATKAGLKILNALNLHNKKFNEKIEFNIGVHSGELVASKEGKKLKYTSVGNMISFAKRMSDFSSGKLIVSEDVKKKLIRDLKTKNAGNIGEKRIYEGYEMKDKAVNQAKLKDLLGRMENSKK